MAILQVEGLVFDYPGLRALHGVSFSLEAGGIAALVGPNGAGKTTLMRCLAGLERPAAGRVAVDGLDLAEEPRSCHRYLGYLSDFFGLYDLLSVRRCLLYQGLAQGMQPGEAEAAARRAAERVGLAERFEQKAGTLSRGLRQRLGIALAILHEPRLVILDEPASGLDPEAREDLSGLFRALSGEGMTLLVSSHILAELSDYATEMLLLSEGRLIEQRGVKEAAGEALALLRITLSEPREDFAQLLQESLAGLHGDARLHKAEAASAEVLLAQDAELHNRLLSALIAAGCKVSGFSARQADLQSLYRESLSRERAGGQADGGEAAR